MDAFECPLSQEGRYRLQFSTGWVIWERFLALDDLLLVHEREDLPLAADMDEEHRHPGIVDLLLDGEYRLSVLPGLTAGTLTIRKA
ncbi:hypothetical protein H5P28_00690 [Ruficoccus amylovorans]|uniref:Uncharacterized protein n=1 Tax=Ruficoccus amylovorans TaxID=1804625 RepID=A0A842HAV7_9BACT|nr:hypothetical protein [Ruficoccus amylovorans]MBC2592767.1 hypothetical protein [Ruficoccus amylovorans]